MGRCGYSDDVEPQAVAMWRGRVMSALRAKRGQVLLRDVLSGLDAMPDKRLIRGELVTQDGVCALGAAAVHRGVDVSKVDPSEHKVLGEKLNAAYCLIQEIEYVNDEGNYVHHETPEQRFDRVRKWLVKHIAQEVSP